MAKETTKGQLIFRGIFLIFMFGGDIVNFIKELFNVSTDALLGWIIFLVFFGPLIGVYFFSKRGTIKQKIVGGIGSHEVERNMSVGGTQEQASYDIMASSTTKDAATTVTGEEVNPYSINGK